MTSNDEIRVGDSSEYFDMVWCPSDHPLGVGDIAGRPTLRLYEDLDNCYVVKNELHDWFMQHGIVYELDTTEPGHLFIRLPDRQALMLFKLVWI